LYHVGKGKKMNRQQPLRKGVFPLHELDLGQHTLFIMSDGSIDDEQTPYFADNMLSLDSEETYHLYISLHEQFKQTGRNPCS
jgi:hypothetical protein